MSSWGVKVSCEFCSQSAFGVQLFAACRKFPIDYLSICAGSMSSLFTACRKLGGALHWNADSIDPNNIWKGAARPGKRAAASGVEAENPPAKRSRRSFLLTANAQLVENMETARDEAQSARGSDAVF